MPSCNFSAEQNTNEICILSQPSLGTRLRFHFYEEDVKPILISRPRNWVWTFSISIYLNSLSTFADYYDTCVTDMNIQHWFMIINCLL